MCYIFNLNFCKSKLKSVYIFPQERIARSHGSQCGFCTPGMVMSMYTLLRNNSQPTELEMEEALHGKIYIYHCKN